MEKSAAPSLAYIIPRGAKRCGKPYNGTMLNTAEIVVPPYAARAIEALEAAGFEAWCVGGCVRDSLLGREVNDYDICTNALWTETQRVFEALGCPTYEVGVKHGTITVLVDGQALEITTYRTDGKYSDARHPDSVRFVRTIREDLARRDFTINALAWHPTRGLLDLYGGLADLRNGTIRAVGEPFARFSEDALRILRGCRFASQLGFSIEPATYAAMNKRKTLMLAVSAERITHELTALLCGPYAGKALMETFDVLCAVMPELAAMKGFDQHTPHHVYDVLEHTAHVIDGVPPEPLVLWTALLHDAGKPAAFFQEDGRGHFFGHATLSMNITRDVMGRLSLSPSFADDVLTLVRQHDYQIAANPRAVKRALARLDGRVDLFRSLCQVKRADALAQAPSSAPRVQLADDLLVVLDEVLAAGDAFRLRDLAINGRDVMALGVEAGPRVGALLQEALDTVIDEQVENDHDALVEWVRARI